MSYLWTGSDEFTIKLWV